VVADPRFWAVVPAVVAPGFLLTGFFFHQVHLVESKGWSLAWYAWCFTGFAISQIVATLVSGPLVDRHGAGRLLPYFLIPLTGGLLLLARFDAPGIALAYLALAGVSAGANRPLGSALWAEAYGTAHLGSIRSVMTALSVLSTAASPVLLGRWIDRGVSVETLAIASVAYLVISSVIATLAFRPNARPVPAA
jgi:MFS family permease